MAKQTGCSHPEKYEVRRPIAVKKGQKGPKSDPYCVACVMGDLISAIKQYLEGKS